MASNNHQFTWPFARGCMGLHDNDGNGRDTRLNFHNLSVRIVVGVCEGNILGWGISMPLSNNVLIRKYGHLWQSIHFGTIKVLHY